MPSILPKLPWHHVLALGPHPFLTPVPKTALQMASTPNPFSHHSKLQLNPHPLPFLHIPQLSRTSLYSFLHQPHTHLLIPCPMNFLDASLLTLIPKPIGLVSRPLLFLQFQA